MKTTATTLRTLVMDNALTLGRLSKEVLGEDYATFTTLYRNALDALTEWASKDYAHKSDKTDVDNAFATVKAILEIFATEEDRIVIDQTSMRTLRDCAIKPKRQYSAEYKKAEKARKEQQKTVESRYEDLQTLGCPSINDDENVVEYVERLKTLGLDTKSGNVDMLEMFENAVATLAVKTKKVKDIKANGNWTWKRPTAVPLNEFADLVENYIADCLIDNYNLKSSKVVREEAKAAREEAKANKKTK